MILRDNPMRNFIRLGVAAALAVVPSISLAQACRYAEIFQEFSQADTFNSSGAPIAEAYAVFQQDRFYVNAQDRRDPADLPDTILVNREARASYGQAVAAFLRLQGGENLSVSDLVGQRYRVTIEACGPADNPTIQIQSIQFEHGGLRADVADRAVALPDPREEALIAREQELETQEAELSQWRDELLQAVALLDQREAAVVAREQQIDKRELELAQRQAEIEERERVQTEQAETLAETTVVQSEPSQVTLPETVATDDRLFFIDPDTLQLEAEPFHRREGTNYFYCGDVMNNVFTNWAYGQLVEISEYHNVPVPDYNLCVVSQRTNHPFGAPIFELDFFITQQQVNDLLNRGAISSIRSVYPVRRNGFEGWQFWIQELPNFDLKACYSLSLNFLYEGLCQP
jgi:hypothetical protein